MESARGRFLIVLCTDWKLDALQPLLFAFSLRPSLAPPIHSIHTDRQYNTPRPVLDRRASFGIRAPSHWPRARFNHKAPPAATQSNTMLLSARGATATASRQQPTRQQLKQITRPVRTASALPRTAEGLVAPASPAPRRRHATAAAARSPTRVFARSREEEEIARIKAEADKDDPWSGDVTVRLLQVALIIGAGAVFVVLFDLAQPLINNTLGSFPSA